jgi:hypothetical protein
MLRDADQWWAMDAPREILRCYIFLAYNECKAWCCNEGDDNGNRKLFPVNKNFIDLTKTKNTVVMLIIMLMMVFVMVMMLCYRFRNVVMMGKG